MSLNRRTFLGLGSLIACGTAMDPQSLFAAGSRVLAGGLPLGAGDEAALAFAQSYGVSVRVVGASVLGRIRTSGLRALHLIVEVDDLSRLQDVLSSAPFTGIYAQDNTLSFALADVDVTIENLLPADFAARLVAMGKRGANAFAHDALAYDPATQRLSDPFGARVGALRVVNKTFGGSAALDVAMRGTIEAKQLGIAAGEDFSMWKGRVLRQIAKSADARKLAGNFLQKLATLADKLPTAQVEAVLRSRLVSTALQQVFGIAVEKVIADFETARATTGGEISNAALWLSLLLAPEIASNAADGAATTWLQRGSRFEVLRSRAALAQARGLVAQSAS